MRRRHHWKQFVLAVTVGSLSALLSIGMSKPEIASAQRHSQERNVRQGLPGRRISGGSRSPSTACLMTPNQPVVALIPKSNLGLTLSERPTFWFSLPAISLDRTLEFGLQDQAGNLIYEQSFAASGKAGIASLSLPDTSAPLSIEKNYRWYLSVVCDPESRSEDLFVTGWIRRVQADDALSAQIDDATLQERLRAYQDSDLWFETISTLAELHRTASPERAEIINEQWIGLLSAAGLTQTVAAPFSEQPAFE